MSEIIIRKYEDGDRAGVIACMEGLQDHIASLDPLKRIVRLSGYGEAYIEYVLDLITKKSGVMYVAEREGSIVGFVAGTLGDHESYEKFARTSVKPYGRIQELFIMPDKRGGGVGSRLMQELEGYFKQLGCDVMMVEAAAYNDRAHDFYRKLGYQNRAIDLLKQL